MNGRLWSTAELAQLEELYGDRTVADIARRLGRTVGSVHNMAGQMHLGRNRPADVLSMNELVKLVIGLDSRNAITRWIREGWLPAKRGTAYGIVNREWWIRIEDLERFLIAYPHELDRDRVQPPFQRLLPERWITLIEAFRRGAAWPLFLESAVKAGLLPRARKRGERGIWVLPESMLAELVAARRRMTSDPEHRLLVLAYNRHEKRSEVAHRKTYLNRRARELAQGAA